MEQQAGSSTEGTRRLFQFKQFVSNLPPDHNHKGIDGRYNPQKYVCREALKNHWEINLNDLLKDANLHRRVDAPRILQSFLQVWSILCYTVKSCDELHMMERLMTATQDISDRSLPLLAPPSWWPSDKSSQDFMQNFIKNQWMFAPLIFNSKEKILRRDLADEQILPIDDCEAIREPQPTCSAGYDSTVFRVRFCRCCILEGHAETVIIKRIGPVPAGHTPAEWESETSILMNFRSHALRPPGLNSESDGFDYIFASPFDYIPAYLGSWNQCCKGTDKMWTIMLEYAALGDLGKFCQQPEAPTMGACTAQEKRAFWDRLLRDLLQSLICIHGTEWVHQDIKESNIVVDRDADAGPNTAAPWRFKIADFGKASLCEPHTHEAKESKNGNHAYMAPECYPQHDVESSVKPRYPKAADIWSLGCLLSNLLVRTQLGEDGVESFLHKRVAENSGGPLQGTGFDKGFYKSRSARLPCVQKMHVEALDACGDDAETRLFLNLVSSLILDHMLQPEGAARKIATSLLNEWTERNSTGLPPPCPPEVPTIPLAGEAAAAPGPGIPRVSLHDETDAAVPGTELEPPGNVTVSQVATMGKWPKSKRTELLRDLDRVLSPLGSDKRLNASRHWHLFPSSQGRRCRSADRYSYQILVDDTQGVNQRNAADTVQAIAKLLKGRAATGGGAVSLVFLCNIDIVYQERSSRRLAQFVRERNFSEARERTPISMWLRNTIEKQSSDKKPPMLYILTNGIFHVAQPDVAGPIRDGYRDGRVPPNSLSVTFVQVGDDDRHRSGQLGLNRVYDEVQAVIRQLGQPSNYHPIFLCNWQDHVGEIIMGRMRNGSRSPSPSRTADTSLRSPRISFNTAASSPGLIVRGVLMNE